MTSPTVAVKALALGAAVMGFVHTAVSGVVYVTPTGDPAADGSNWENATTLAHACEIVPAGTASECSEIILKAGTVESPAIYDYSSQVGGSCVATLTAANVRIRSAADDLDSRKVVIKGGGDYRRFLVSASGFQMAGLTVRDFMMTNGACVVKGPVALATNCAFVANFSTNKVGAATTSVYSALFCNTSASFCNCDFTDNIGGPYANNDDLVNASCLAGGNNKLYGCRFTGNRGAVALSVAQGSQWSSASLMATNCTFRENVGGVLNKHYMIQNCTFTDCKFYGNRGDSRAMSEQRWCIGRGGSFVHCELGGNSSDAGFGGNSYTACLATNNACGFAAASLTRCVVSNNVMATLTTGSVTDTLVLSNTFTGSWAVIGADREGPTVRRSTFVRNRFKQCFLRGSYGAATGGKAPRAEDCLFVGNVCTTVNNETTGIFYASDGRYVAVGCTVADNDCGGGYAFGHTRVSYINQIANCLSFGDKSCDVYGGSTYCMTNTLYGTIKTATTHAESVDSKPISNPRFSSRTDALHPFGYSLSARSLARNAGRDIGYAEGAKDLTGVLPRVIDGTVDVGCYEFQPIAGLMLFVR